MVRISSKSLVLLFGFIFGVCFLGSYLGIAWFNRFSNDDFEFLNLASRLGVTGGIRYFYFNWEGAYFVEFLNFSLFGLADKYQLHPFFLNCSILLTLFIALTMVIHRILDLLSSASQVPMSIVISMLILANLYYTSLAVSEVWFWVNGNIAYLFTLAFFLLSVRFVLKMETNGRVLTGICILMFLFAGTRLNYAVITFCLLLATAFLGFLGNRWIVYKPVIIWAILFVLVGLIIYVIAPGNYIRKNHFQISYSGIDIIANTFRISADYIWRYVINKSVFHFIFLFPVALLIHLFARPAPDFFALRVLIVFWLLAVVVNSFVMYISKGAQTTRALPLLDLITSVALVGSFIFGIAKFNVRQRFEQGYLPLVALLFAIGMLFLLRRFFVNYPVVKQYAHAVDLRTKLILETKQSPAGTTTLYLMKLPPSGWLHSAEIGDRSENPSNNLRLERYFDVPFEIDLLRDSSVVSSRNGK